MSNVAVSSPLPVLPSYTENHAFLSGLDAVKKVLTPGQVTMVEDTVGKEIQKPKARGEILEEVKVLAHTVNSFTSAK